MNLKTISRIIVPFLNIGFLYKILALFTSRRNRPFMLFEKTVYTYKDVYDQAKRYEKIFRAVKHDRMNQGLMKRTDPLAVGLYMDNCPDFVFAAFGASFCGATIFCINTGFRGETLVNVIEQAGCSLLFTSDDKLVEVDKIIEDINVLGKEQIFVVGSQSSNKKSGYQHIEVPLSDPEIQQVRYFWKHFNHWTPLVVIYTSGTTGAPKGVPCTHMKLIGAGIVTNTRIHLKKSDRGYICMPLFHSNAWFIGILPLIMAGGSFFLKPRFSASAFEKDILEHGVTYMNYVGQPIHYILIALEKKHGGPEGVEKTLSHHPANRFRLAHGNGAPPVDREKLRRYLGMEHVYELYGSTEAAITTTNQPGDPIDSLGVVSSKKIVILNEQDEICPYGTVDENGQLTNYETAVGEICKKVGKNNVIFDGYFNNAEANQKKFRNSCYHSGDLGHMRLIDGKRYLYFDGRTDDWIRKDGENFSAENVLQYALKIPGVALAAAHGAPCEVSDEKVMVAIQLKKGEVFDPKETFDFFVKQQKVGGMDPKWMPDYIRIVDGFDMTHQTQKILVRPLKAKHFNIDNDPDMAVYFRKRGDETYQRLTPEAFETIKKAFAETGRTNLI